MRIVQRHVTSTYFALIGDIHSELGRMAVNTGNSNGNVHTSQTVVQSSSVHVMSISLEGSFTADELN